MSCPNCPCESEYFKLIRYSEEERRAQRDFDRTFFVWNNYLERENLQNWKKAKEEKLREYFECIAKQNGKICKNAIPCTKEDLYLLASNK